MSRLDLIDKDICNILGVEPLGNRLWLKVYGSYQTIDSWNDSRNYYWNGLNIWICHFSYNEITPLYDTVVNMYQVIAFIFLS